MSLSYTVPQNEITVAAADPNNLGGEDIALPLDVTPAGDWAVVTGRDAGRQSILREFGSNPKEFVRRPEWGVGLKGLLFKGATSQVRDQAISQGKTRLNANPRVRRVLEVSGRLPATGLAMTIRVDTVDGRVDVVDRTFKP